MFWHNDGVIKQSIRLRAYSLWHARISVWREDIHNKILQVVLQGEQLVILTSNFSICDLIVFNLVTTCPPTWSSRLGKIRLYRIINLLEVVQYDSSNLKVLKLRAYLCAKNVKLVPKPRLQKIILNLKPLNSQNYPVSQSVLTVAGILDLIWNCAYGTSAVCCIQMRELSILKTYGSYSPEIHIEWMCCKVYCESVYHSA